MIAGARTANTTACAMSAGVDERPSGVLACAAAKPASVCSPEGSVMPGATPTTRTRGASARASSTVASFSALFDSV